MIASCRADKWRRRGRGHGCKKQSRGDGELHEYGERPSLFSSLLLVESRVAVRTCRSVARAGMQIDWWMAMDARGCGCLCQVGDEEPLIMRCIVLLPLSFLLGEFPLCS